MGTPAYMAPEQAGGKVDDRGDLFSLGCVLYRMATGELPFKGMDTMSTLMAVATEPPRPPRRGQPRRAAGVVATWYCGCSPRSRTSGRRRPRRWSRRSGRSRRRRRRKANRGRPRSSRDVQGRSGSVSCRLARNRPGARTPQAGLAAAPQRWGAGVRPAGVADPRRAGRRRLLPLAASPLQFLAFSFYQPRSHKRARVLPIRPLSRTRWTNPGSRCSTAKA